MSRSGSGTSSWGRKSFLSLSSLNSNTNDGSDTADQKRAKVLKKNSLRKTPKLFTALDHPDLAHEAGEPQSATVADSPKLQKPSLSLRGIHRRHTSSAHGSFSSSVRSSSEELIGDVLEEPPSATSSSATSIGDMDGSAPARRVLLHGEVQTSSGMFRKKKEYLVLTEIHLIRCKSQARAADVFKGFINPPGKSHGAKHGSVPSVGSQSDLQTLSDSSGEKDGRVSLRQVVAVHRLDDGRPYFAFEVSYLDEASGHASAMTLQFSNPEDRDGWLRAVRHAAHDAGLGEQHRISSYNLDCAARIMERDRDYDPSNCAVFKVVQRSSASKPGRSSSDDLAKATSSMCLLAIGVHKVHIVPVVKSQPRSSSPSLGSNTAHTSYGILTMTSIRVSPFDDTIEVTFRQPLHAPRHVYMASTASHEIAIRLFSAEDYLRPDCGHSFLKFKAPRDVEELLPPPAIADEEHGCLDRTLAAYCSAYHVNAATVRYTINYNCEDAPLFELLPPADARRPEYGPFALLAIVRALRYNETFGSISFAGINLDSLNGLHDNYGQEYVCSRTKRGTAIKLSVEELERSCLLVQEVRALAATSKKLRRVDFSGCITAKVLPPVEQTDDETTRAKDIGCGVVEALFPLCRYQTTNVDWICLNNIQLSDADLDYLVGAAVDKSCHFRAIELNRCGLNDRSMGLILDALRAQDNTLEAIEIAGNTARIDPVHFDSQLSMFGFIRKLNLSYVSRTSGTGPLLSAETLLVWRLQELRLSGTALNPATIDAVATYLAHPNSRTLHQLYFDNAFLSGQDIATLLHSLAQVDGGHRDLHLDISQNPITRGLEDVTKAIADGLTPSHLSMRAIEYREESLFRKMLTALTENKTIKYLDISQAALPGDAGDETCRALAKLLAENDSLIELDVSGEDSRLACSRFGPGINDALMSLAQNRTLEIFRIEKQRLGLQGASTLAEVLKENRSLREVYCDNNEIPLHGLTDLVNSLIENTTLIYLPSMSDGREAAFRSAETTMKVMSALESPTSGTSPKSSPLSSASGVQRKLTSVRKTAARAASAYTPSFPALTAYGRTVSSPDTSKSSAPSISLTLPPSKSRQNSHSSVATSTVFTVQDIQTTHRLLSEQWDRQCYRLQQYLERNWCLLHNIPVDMEIEDEKFERPESAGSLAKVLEQVKFDTTPRNEKDAYFDDDGTVAPAADLSTLPHSHSTSLSPDSAVADSPDEKTSFKHFILGARPDSPASSEDAEDRPLHLRVEPHQSEASLEGPKTPTQAGFKVS